MNVLVIDTSSWIAYFSGSCTSEGDIDLALKEARVILSPVVAAELLSGIKQAGDRTKLSDFLRDLPLCESGLEHWLRVGELQASLRHKGLQVSTPDAHIAQCCLDVDGYLVSEDKIFSKIAKVARLRLLP